MSWDVQLSLIEFTYNNSYNSNIKMAYFEALYGRHCKTPVCWEEVGKSKLYDSELVQATTKNIKVTKENLKIFRDRQTSYTDNNNRALNFRL